MTGANPDATAKPVREQGPPAARAYATWLERKKRPCLRCGKAFMSQHAGNRMCTPCKSNDIVDRPVAHHPDSA